MMIGVLFGNFCSSCFIKISVSFYVKITFFPDFFDDLTPVAHIVTKLANGETLDPKHKDHSLSGNWTGHRECHIQPDWLLIYRYEEEVLVLTLSRTGTHSDLFNL